MYNQSALIRIAKQLFPEKNVFQLTKSEQREVLAIYNEFHQTYKLNTTTIG